MIRRPPRSTLFPTRRSSDLRVAIMIFFIGQVPCRWGAAADPARVHSLALRSRQLLGRRNGSERGRSEEHTSELQSRQYLVCRLLLEKKNTLCLSREAHYNCS